MQLVKSRRVEVPEEWLVKLRERFTAITRRRVPKDAVEDVVQEALRVIYERGMSANAALELERLPKLAWCFQVLRFTIGNYYQKRRVEDRKQRLDVAYSLPSGTTPLESLEAQEIHRLVVEAIDELDRSDPKCSTYLRRLLEGETPATIAKGENVEPAVLYRRIYRCRAKLRERLAGKGVLP